MAPKLIVNLPGDLMNVNSIVSQIQPLSLLSSLQQQKTSLAASIGAPSDSVSANLSSMGQYFNELQQLSTQNPAEFKTITAEISQKLDTQAQNSSDPTQAAQLKAIAARFDQASQTGDFSSLLPAQSGTTAAGGKHHGGHHHHGSYEPPASTDATTTTTSSVLSSIFSQVTPQIQSALGTPATTT
jgi:hypothetical protein